MADDRDKLLFRMKHLVPKLSHPKIEDINEPPTQSSATSLLLSNELEEAIFPMTWGNLRGNHSFNFLFL